MHETDRSRADLVYAGPSIPRAFVSDPFLTRGCITIGSSVPGRGKSSIALALALGIAALARDEAEGKKPPLLAPSPLGGDLIQKNSGAVLFISVEDDSEEVKRRLNLIDSNGERRARSPLWIKSATDLSDITVIEKVAARYQLGPFAARLRDWIEDIIEKKGDIALLVLDPGQSMVDDEIDAGAVKRLMAVLSEMAVNYDMAILILAHLPKASGQVEEHVVAKSGPRGSGAWVGRARCALVWYIPCDKEALAVAELCACNPRDVLIQEVYKKNYYIPDDMLRLTFVPRGQHLIDVTRQIRAARSEDLRERSLPALVSAITKAHADGKPFSRTGENGRLSAP